MESVGAHPLKDLKKGIIWFGGIAPVQAVKLLVDPCTVGVGFGNLNFEKETAFRSLRRFFQQNVSRALIRKTYDA
jgi:hypothetical protein